MKLLTIYVYPIREHLLLEGEDPQGTYPNDYTSTRLDLYRSDSGFRLPAMEITANQLPEVAFVTLRNWLQAAANDGGWHVTRVIIDRAGSKELFASPTDNPAYNPAIPATISNPLFGEPGEPEEIPNPAYEPPTIPGASLGEHKMFEFIVSKIRISDDAQQTVNMASRNLPANIAIAVESVWDGCYDLVQPE